jgi:hypothetical protein
MFHAIPPLVCTAKIYSGLIPVVRRHETNSRYIDILVPLLKPISPNYVNVEESISTTDFDLNEEAFEQTSNISVDYILSHIYFHFTTVAPRNIEVIAHNGSIIWSEENNTNLDIRLENINQPFDSGQNFQISVSQTAAACLMNLVAVVLK